MNRGGMVFHNVTLASDATISRTLPEAAILSDTFLRDDKCSMKSMAAKVGLDLVKDKYAEAVKAGKLPMGPWEIPTSVEELAEKLWDWSGGKLIKDTVAKLVEKGIAV
eukprot:2429733-Amphidinium_carterae.1